LTRAPRKRFATKLALLALLFLGQAVSPGDPSAAFNQPAAAINLASNPSAFQAPGLPEGNSMLVAGAVLMILGFVGRKRKAD
jgi:hypothetical protein